ncbi:hypothetical protein JCM10213_000131 [Rhodosporidiobolus nylandii]
MRPNSVANVLGTSKSDFAKLLRLILVRYTQSDVVSAQASSIADNSRRLNEIWPDRDDPHRKFWSQILTDVSICPDDQAAAQRRSHYPEVLPDVVFELLHTRPSTDDELAAIVASFLDDHANWWNADGKPSGRTSVYKSGDATPAAGDGEDGGGEVEQSGRTKGEAGEAGEAGDGQDAPPEHESSTPASSATDSSGTLAFDLSPAEVAAISCPPPPPASPSGGGGDSKHGHNTRSGGRLGSGVGSKAGDGDLLGLLSGAASDERAAARDEAGRKKGGRKKKDGQDRRAGGQGAPPARAGGEGYRGGTPFAGVPPDGDDSSGSSSSSKRGSQHGGDKRGGKKRDHPSDSSSASSSESLSGVLGTGASDSARTAFAANFGSFIKQSKKAEDEHLRQTKDIADAARYYGKKAFEEEFKKIGSPLPPDVAYTSAVDEYVDLAKINGAGVGSTSSEPIIRDEGDGSFKFAAATYSKAKAITSAYEWEKCFLLYEQLAIALFPHRVDEFKKYREHLKQLMGEEPAILALWLEYDRQYRSNLGKPGYSARLDDVYSDTGGSGASGSGAAGGEKKEKKKSKKPKKADEVDEPCRNYNTKKGRCKDEVAECQGTPKRRHLRLVSSPPEAALRDPVAHALLRKHRHLLDFEHRTPYHLDILERLLTTGDTRHPNQPLVLAFLHVMRNGAWPFHSGDFSQASSLDYPINEEDRAFVEQKGQDGFEAGRMSAPFTELEDGMICSPSFVRHPTGGKARWIIDQTSSGLNAGIERDDVRPTYDMVDELVRLLRYLFSLPPEQRAEKVLLWRGDVKDAFWGIPVHVLWQLRQVLRFQDKDGNVYYRFDYRLQFGNRASPFLWSIAQGFLLWIARKSTSIACPFVFVDDSFGGDGSGKVVHREHHGEKVYLPQQLDELLDVYDLVGAPYDLLKQISSVDPKTGEVLDYIKLLGLLFKKGEKVRLSTWRTWLGHAQFVGLAAPWAKWRLGRLYADVAKVERDQGGRNVAFRVKDYQAEIVEWFLDEVLHAAPISILDATLQRWTIKDADVVIWADSCGVAFSGGGGLGFVISSKALGEGGDLGYWYRHPTPITDNNFGEGVALYSAFDEAVKLFPSAKRFLLFSDNSAVIYAADAGRGTAAMLELAYRFFLLSRKAKVDYRVRHVPGRLNSRADTLSRAAPAQLRAEWGNKLSTFVPSAALVGATAAPSPKRKRVHGLRVNRFAQPSHKPPLSLDKLKSLRNELKLHHIKPSTARGYHSARKHWHRFTKQHGFSPRPTEETLQLYAAYLVSRGITSLKQPFAALRSKYKHLPEWTTIRSSSALKEVLVGARKMYAKEIKQAQPINTAAVVDFVQLAMRKVGGHDGLLLAFIASTAYLGLLRLGEAVAPQNPKDFNVRDIAKRVSLERRDGFLSFNLPYSRSDNLYQGGKVVITNEFVPAELPYFEIADAYLSSRDAWLGAKDANGALFARRDGSLISRNRVIKLLAQVGGFTGHSFRSGGATMLAELGLPDLEIQRAGRWQKDSYLRYVRQHPSILAATRRSALQAAVARL